MAVKKKSGDDAGYKKFRADLAAGNLGNVYLFYGEETYLREFYLAEVKKQLVPPGFEAFNFHRLEGKGLTVQALTEAAEAMPMMAGRTMVQVTDYDPYKLPEEQRNALVALLSDFPSHCCLIFVYDQLPYAPNKTVKTLCKAIDAHVSVVQFDKQSRSDLLNWVTRRCKACGKSIDNQTAEHLIFTCGSLMNTLIPEIEKVSAYAKNERVTKADIDAVAAPVLEAQVFDMTGAVSKGDFDRAAEVLGSLLRLQEEPFMLLALIGKELVKLARKQPITWKTVNLLVEVKALVILGILLGTYFLSKYTGMFVIGAVFCALGFLVFFRCKKWSYYAITLGLAVGIWCAFRFGLGVSF